MLCSEAASQEPRQTGDTVQPRTLRFRQVLPQERGLPEVRAKDRAVPHTLLGPSFSPGDTHQPPHGFVQAVRKGTDVFGTATESRVFSGTRKSGRGWGVAQECGLEQGERQLSGTFHLPGSFTRVQSLLSHHDDSLCCLHLHPRHPLY